MMVGLIQRNGRIAYNHTEQALFTATRTREWVIKCYRPPLFELDEQRERVYNKRVRTEVRVLARRGRVDGGVPTWSL